MGNASKPKTGIKMTAKYDGKCGCCGCPVVAGTPIVFFPERRNDRYSNPTWHLDCARHYHAEVGCDALGRPRAA